MKEGIEIVAVNGKQIDATYSGSVLSHWAHQPAGTSVKLTLANGSIQQLTLEDLPKPSEELDQNRHGSIWRWRPQVP